ncbi:MAG: AAA family ATPase [Kiritimatiellae bacterium]|nr:AAA family ATPase [Kiritimatiellia bacterium]
MRIKKIDIKNYRAIRDFSLTLDDHDDFLVLAGLNGSGKSSVLEAILTALGSPFDMREPLKGQKYSVSLLASDGSSDYEFDSCGGAAKNKKTTPRITALYFSSWRAPKRVHGIALNVNKKGRRPDKDERNALWNLKQGLVNLPGYASYPSGKEMYQKLIKVNDEVNGMWHDFYPNSDETFEADFESGSMEEMMRLGSSVEPKYELYLKRNDGDGGRISVDELSSGEIELLSLFGTLILDKAMTGRPIDFVFLDEPELHLNPVWHHRLVYMLKRYAMGTQFFIATHSPAIWDSVYSTERIYLKDGSIRSDRLPEPDFKNEVADG